MFRSGVFPEERASLLRRMPGIHGIRRMGGCAGRSMNGKRSGPGTEWRKTYCPRTVPWYAVNMAGMSRFLLIVLLLCGAFPLFSRAQDIASPGMPVVDLDSETGKKIQEERAVICGFMVVLVLNQMILMLEEDPAEKMDDEQFDKVFKEYCNRCNEMNAPMMEKYRLRERSSLFFRMLESKVIGLNREERMKALQRMKDDLIAGKLKIPGENEGMEEETGWIR